MAELSSDEMEKVRLEEMYRTAVRRQSEAEPNKPAGLKGFLNSNFGLWLLSAVFISGFGTLYQSCENRAAAEKAQFERDLNQESERTAAIARLDLEISYRLSKALIELNALHIDLDVTSSTNVRRSPSSAAQKAPASGTRAMEVLERLSEVPRDAAGTLYPEFSKYSLPTLQVQLRLLLPADQQRIEIESSIASLAGMGKDSRHSIRTPKEAAALLMDRVVLSRWKESRFYFVDCSKEMPFC